MAPEEGVPLYVEDVRAVILAVHSFSTSRIVTSAITSSVDLMIFGLKSIAGLMSRSDRLTD